MDFEKFYKSYRYALALGFDLDKNSARDFIITIYYIYENYDECVKEKENE